LTPEDFHNNFGVTNWAEIGRNYGVDWVDHWFTESINTRKKYQSEFTVSGANNRVLYA